MTTEIVRNSISIRISGQHIHILKKINTLSSEKVSVTNDKEKSLLLGITFAFFFYFVFCIFETRYILSSEVTWITEDGISLLEGYAHRQNIVVVFNILNIVDMCKHFLTN